MSPKCGVSLLNNLALNCVVKQVTHALSDEEGAYYNEVTNYHKYTPPDILEDVLKEVLKNEILDAGTRFSCLQVLLKNNVRKLEIGMFPHSYYDRILAVLLHQGNGLQYLDLKGVWVKDNPDLLRLALTQMVHLKVLHIPHIADDGILQFVANCTNLRVLNISGDCPFSKQGLDNFCQLLRKRTSCLINTLDIGSFGEENIPHEVIADIIEALPELVTLSSYSYVGKALLYIYRKNKTFKTKLKFIHDTKSTIEICAAVAKVCPNLENIYFDTPNEGVIENIAMFKTALNCLKINKFQCHELHKLFETWGQNLHTLKLSLGRGIIDLSKVCASCFNITKMELYKMEFVTHTSEEAFYRLQSMEIWYSEMNSACLKYIMERAPELKKLVVGEPVGITDGDIYRLCADYCLLCLEELWLANARYLTVNAVELLMGHCPLLRVLGQLSGWNLTPNDINFIRAVMQSTNSDLTLLPIGLYM